MPEGVEALPIEPQKILYGGSEYHECYNQPCATHQPPIWQEQISYTRSPLNFIKGSSCTTRHA